jgi:hypothetical protein
VYDGQPRPVTLWSVDPVTGDTELSVVRNVYGAVTGFAFVRARGYLLVGTADLAQNDTVRTAYRFYAMTFAKYRLQRSLLLC